MYYFYERYLDNKIYFSIFAEIYTQISKSMKKNLFFAIMAVAIVAIPFLSSCSDDEGDPSAKAAALQKNKWYLAGYAEDGKYTEVGNGVGNPRYTVSFKEQIGRAEGRFGANTFSVSFRIIGKSLIWGNDFIATKVGDSDPFSRTYANKLGKSKTFDFRDGQLQLSETANTYLLFSDTYDPSLGFLTQPIVPTTD